MKYSQEHVFSDNVSDMLTLDYSNNRKQMKTKVNTTFTHCSVSKHYRLLMKNVSTKQKTDTRSELASKVQFVH